MRHAGSVAVLILATGCIAGCTSGCTSGAGAGAGGVLGLSGTFEGKPLTLVDVGSLVATGGTGSGPLAVAEVFATSEAPACGWFNGTNVMRANLTTLSLLVTSTGTATASHHGYR